MKPQFIFLAVMAGIAFVFSNCRKESIQSENNTFQNNSVAGKATANQNVYVKSVYAFTDSVTGGESFNITVILNQPAPAGGFKAYITTTRPTGPIIDVPAYTTIPEGESTGTITVHTIPVRYAEIEVFFVKPASDIVGLMYLIKIVPRPINDPRPPLQFLEAENAILNGAHAVYNADPYFSNGGFTEYTKSTGGSVKFNFNIEKSGKYFLVLKYATPSKYSLKTVSMNVFLNGIVRTVQFPFTANETATQIVNITQYLRNGVNTIDVTTIGKGSERLDYLEVAAK